MVDLEEERQRYRARRRAEGDDEEVVMDATPREKALGTARARAAEPYVRKLRQQIYGSEEPLTEYPDEHVFTVPKEGIKALAEATGFSEASVYRWIFHGVEPSLPRVVLTYPIGGSKELPDGTRVGHRSLSLTFNAPVTQREVQQLYRRHIRGFWDTGHPLNKGPDVSDLDLHLLEIVRSTPDLSWAERQKVWKDTPPAGTSPSAWRKEHGSVGLNALKTRWHRIDPDVRRRYDTSNEEDPNGEG